MEHSWQVWTKCVATRVCSKHNNRWYQRLLSVKLLHTLCLGSVITNFTHLVVFIVVVYLSKMLINFDWWFLKIFFSCHTPRSCLPRSLTSFDVGPLPPSPLFLSLPLPSSSPSSPSPLFLSLLSLSSLLPRSSFWFCSHDEWAQYSTVVLITILPIFDEGIISAVSVS